MIEVHGEKLQNMRRLVQRKEQNMLLEMHDRNASQQGPRRGVLGPCGAIPGQAGPLLGTSRIDVGGGATAERSTAAGDQTANAGIGLPAGN